MSASAGVDFGLDITDPSTYADFVWEFGTKAAGSGTPQEMVVANVAISAFAIVSSYLTLGATLLVLVVSLPLLAVGLLWLAYEVVA